MAADHTSQTHAGELAHGDGEKHGHGTPRVYVLVGVVLAALTGIEVALYYTPGFEDSRAYRPTMLILSTLKFILVVMFYMHLKYDAKVFRALFIGPLTVAIITAFALMFLFGQMSIRF